MAVAPVGQDVREKALVVGRHRVRISAGRDMRDKRLRVPWIANQTCVLRLANRGFRILLQHELCPEKRCGERNVDRDHTPEQRTPESP
jgi:hypothetical protein